MQPAPITSLIADDPIIDAAADRLDRLAFAERAACVVEQVRAESDSAVMAVIGPWGSGKTSALNLIAATIHSESRGWRLVRFNPWLVSDLDSLVRTFFDAIAEEMPDGSDTRDKLRRYAGALAPWSKVLSVIPGVPSGVADLGGALEKLGTEKSLTSMRDGLEKSLSKLDQPLLVLVDDLDRLHPDELTLLFKLVRLAGRLPRLYYLLAFDERTLLDVLQTTEVARCSEDRALAYLEKIVQIRLDLPPLHEAQASALMDACWSRVIATNALGDDFLRQERYRWLVRQWLQLGLDEPRKIKRLFAQVEAVLPLVVGELDATDLLAVTYLRTYAPGLYRKLRGSKSELAWPPIGDPVGDAYVDSEFAPLLSELFPSVAVASGKDREGAVQESCYELSNDKRIASADYFDRYFRLGIPAGDVADATIARALRAATGMVGTAALRSQPPVASVIAAVKSDSGRVLRKLRRESREFGYAERVSAVRLGGCLYSDLSATWGWPAQPVAVWAGKLLAPGIDDDLTRTDVEQIAGDGGGEYLARALMEILPKVVPEDADWSARKILISWPGDFGEAILEWSWAELDLAVQQLDSLSASAADESAAAAAVEAPYKRLRVLVPLAALDRADEVRRWLLSQLDKSRVRPVPLVAALHPASHDEWRPERIQLGDLGADWPLGRVVSLQELGARLTRDVVGRGEDFDKSDLSFENRVRIAYRHLTPFAADAGSRSD